MLQDKTIKTIMKIICKRENVVMDGVNYYETITDSEYFVLDMRTKVILKVSQKNFLKKRDELIKQIFQNTVYEIRVSGINYKVLLIRKTTKFIPQSLIGNFMNAMGNIKNTVEFMAETCRKSKKIFSEQGYLWFLDLINMILNIREGYLTPTKVISVIISIYTMYRRVSGIFAPQSLEDVSFDAASVIFSVIGLPAHIVKIIRDYSMITGKRLFSSSTILSIILSIYQLFKHFLRWLVTFLQSSEQNVYLAGYADYLLDVMFGSISSYSKIKSISELNLQYSLSPEVILRPEYRDEVLKVYNDANEDLLFKDYVVNNDNKNFKVVWDSFVTNIVKYVKTFTVSAKKEPICIVFEGQPGSGKSVLMNNFVEVLRKMNKSVYIHSIPPTDAGKDFYDDYENQDVFVMDDIGQQGKSQWRTIINFVSPVKYPLECANANKKNTKFFNSEFILCTTNGFMNLHGFTAKDCVAEPEALFRRCHVVKVEGIVGADFTQNLTYYKYDHLAGTPKWENKFLYHNSKITLPTRLVASNKIETLGYMRQLLLQLEKFEEENRRSVQISDDDMNAIMNQQFAPQTLTDISTFLSNLYYEWKPQTRDIFLEWFTYVLKPVKTVLEAMAHYFKNLLFGISYDSEVLEIIRAKTPVEVLGKADRVNKYRTLSRKYHPDKHTEQSTLTREEYTLIFIIINLANQYYDDPQNFYEQMQAIYSDPRSNFYINLVKDNLGTKHHEYIRDSFAYIKILISGIPHLWAGLNTSEKISVIYLSVYVAAVVGALFASWMGESKTPIKDLRTVWEEAKLGNNFMPQTHIEVTSKKFIKYAVIRNDKVEHETHILVSGDTFLVNSHLGIDEGVISVYNTYEHFLNKHAEVENIKFNTISNYISCDIRTCRFRNLHPYFPKISPLFRSREVTPLIQMYTSLGHIDLILHKNVFHNDISVDYVGYDGVSYNHGIQSGLLTPIEGSGLCGSFILNSHGDIIAIHVAGDGKQGFCVVPTSSVAEMIRTDMFSTHPLPVNIDTRVKEGFSGTRLVYESGDVSVPYINGKSKIVPSVFHVDHCEEMKKFVDVIKGCEEPIVVPVSIDNRGPPIITKPIETLKQTSMKSFSNQGVITFEELDFVKECIRTMMPKEEYDDLTPEECAFGGVDIASFDKNTSNGYGHPDKQHYFDFENKIIKEEFINECMAFEDRVRNNKLEYKDFLTKEVFKVDELRNQEKREKPRTIRVMPITNIWYTKRIFGNLAKYIKEHRAENGIGYGFNPYTDMDRVYKRLAQCFTRGDLDAAKWDGSLVSLMMEAIIEVMFEKYKGQFRYMESYMIKSIVRSFVLVSDEMYATTHGLPSGTWLTLLLNSLYNRALDALVLFRKHPAPTVSLFSKIYSEVTGDDKVFGVPNELSPYVNLLTYKEVFESLGMKCTNGDKSEITQPTQSLEKLTYLKRHFRFHPVLRKWVGPLSINTILSICQWISTDSDYQEAMFGKMRATQVEAYLHSPSLFAGLTEIFEKKFGYAGALFSETEVIKILTSNDGFAMVCNLRNKYNYAEL